MYDSWDATSSECKASPQALPDDVMCDSCGIVIKKRAYRLVFIFFFFFYRSVFMVRIWPGYIVWVKMC